MDLSILIPLDKTVVQELNLLRLGLRGLAEQQEENFYLPLVTLGEVEGSLQIDIEGELSFLQQPRFQLEIKGTLSSKQGPFHILSAKVSPSIELEAFKRKIYTLLKPLKLKEMKMLEPHVPLAKWEKTSDTHLAQWLERTAQFACPPFQLSYFALYSFHPTYKKNVFKEEKIFPFDPPAPQLF